MPTAFNWLPAGDFRVGRQKEPGRPPVCHDHDNPFLAVAKFARFMGLTSVPAATIAKLKTDPYYKYCFYQLKDRQIYDLESTHSAVSRARLKTILTKPDSYDDQDLYLGLLKYFNNFTHRFPGEAIRRDYEAHPDHYPLSAQKFMAIDRVLGENGRQTALALYQDEQLEIQLGVEYTKRAARLKFYLMFFEVLVAEGRFTPDQLWA